MKRILLLFTVLFAFSSVFGEGVHSKAYSKRVELIGYMRFLEPIVKNYPNSREKYGNDESKNNKKGNRAKEYAIIRRLFQEGLLFYYEGKHVNAYTRFLEAQLGTEKLLEKLSQEHIERTEDMMKACVDRKDESNPNDKTLVDITVEFGDKSKVRRFHAQNRESIYLPADGKEKNAKLYDINPRIYEPKQYHYVLNKGAIEENVERGMQNLAFAKTARIKALKIENTLEEGRILMPTHRKYRIEQYLAAISKSREARWHASNVFKLKYPYDNHNHLINAGKTKLEGVDMEYRDNPYAKLKNLRPVFDNRIPQDFRRDATDIYGRVYEEEIDEGVRLKYSTKEMRKDFGVPDPKKEEKGKDSDSGKSDDSSKGPGSPTDTPATPTE
jgi:hypothetical protein